MVEVDIMLQINATFEKVWNIISAVDNDRNYWKEIVRIKNISQDGNVIAREIHLLNGNKCEQRITLFPKEGIHMQWTKGPFSGIKDIMLIDNGSTTIIRVQINYKLERAGNVDSTSVLEELQYEAERALKLIKKEAECKPYGIAYKRK